MNDLSLSIVLPALAAGLLVAATHVPLGMQVLARGIVFIDIAIAQLAGVGVLAADFMGFEPHGLPVQAWALGAALLGALLLTWTERRWPEVQEGIIGVVFVLAATAEILLLAGNPHGGEHLKDLLVGQILWVGHAQLLVTAAVTAVLLAAWFGLGGRLGRTGFYVVFGVSVTISVQLVGVYLVFATLIIPALATRALTRWKLGAGWAIAAAGYAAGLLVSAIYDLPSGAVIVWALGMAGVVVFALTGNARRVSGLRAAPPAPRSPFKM